MQTLHEMLRESLWAAALNEAELDAVARESHERHAGELSLDRHNSE